MEKINLKSTINIAYIMNSGIVTQINEKSVINKEHIVNEKATIHLAIIEKGGIVKQINLTSKIEIG